MKLKYGHRGGQPAGASDLLSERTYITTPEPRLRRASRTALPGGRLRFVNANDGTCEGIDYPEMNAFSVQFHPEACAGPARHVISSSTALLIMMGGKHACRRNEDIKKVLVIGSGPIVIGQAAEFDYAGHAGLPRAQARRALKVVLVNSNPATIMTDRRAWPTKSTSSR